MSKKTGILAMNEDGLFEVDGVMFDADSYARYLAHNQPTADDTASEATAPASEEAPAPEASAPAPVFYTDPQPAGWYPETEDRAPVPIMRGAVPPLPAEEAPAEPPAENYFVPVEFCEEIRTPVGAPQQRLVYGGGSGSGSYLTSYTTSYLTSYRYGSGSGSFQLSSGVFAAGGYGLELI